MLSVFTCFTTPHAYSEDLYSSSEYWGYYLDSCNKLDAAVAEVKKQISEGSDAFFSNGIKFNLERMSESLPRVDNSDRNSQQQAECQAKSTRARKVLSQAEAYQKQVYERQSKEARKQHEASPIYKKAQELGYNDFGWLSALKSYYNEVGGEQLKQWIIVVDSSCGSSYKAIQYVEPYVIYSPSRSRFNTCTGKEMAAVLPPEGAAANRGEYIDRDSYYVFAGIIKGTGADGFPVRMPLLKQYKKKH